MLVTDKSSNHPTFQRWSIPLSLSIWCPSRILPSSTSGKPYSVFTGLVIKCDDLTLEGFVAGYGQILQSRDLPEMERSARLKHLVSLMYFAQQYEWQAVLSFHGAVLLEIERGLLKWGDSLFHLDSRTLYGHPKTPKSSTSGGSSTSSTTVLYCRDFQRQQCSFNQAHYGYLCGERKWLRHCWVFPCSLFLRGP